MVRWLYVLPLFVALAVSENPEGKSYFFSLVLLRVENVLLG